MTEGIDVATSQAGINWSIAKKQGISFAAVKMGGFNVAPMYVAPHYHAQIDGAHKVGFPVTHYWVAGKLSGASAVEQAQYFVHNLYHFLSTDNLALDNETLDSNGQTWRDNDVAAFITEVLKLTGIQATKFWLYGSSVSTFQDYGPWPKTEKLITRFWVADYGTNSPARSKEPSWHPWTVHQYTSRGTVGGIYGVDKDFSPASVSKLFPKKQAAHRAPAPAPAPAPVPKPTPTPTPVPVTAVKESSMPIIAREETNPNCYYLEGTAGVLLTPAQLSVYRLAGVPVTHVPDGSLTNNFTLMTTS